MERKHLIKLFLLLLLALGGCKRQEAGYVFAGDSHIARWNLHNYFTYSNITNLGLGGDTIKGIQQRLTSNSSTTQTLVIEIGTNDCMKYYNATADTTGLFDYFSQRYTPLLNYLTTRYKHIYVIGIIPVASYYNNHKFDLLSGNCYPQLNNWLNSQSSNYPNITYVECNSLLYSNEYILKGEYSTDGLHLNEAGYQLLSNSLNSYLD